MHEAHMYASSLHDGECRQKCFPHLCLPLSMPTQHQAKSPASGVFYDRRSINMSSNIPQHAVHAAGNCSSSHECFPGDCHSPRVLPGSPACCECRMLVIAEASARPGSQHASSQQSPWKRLLPDFAENRSDWRATTKTLL